MQESPIDFSVRIIIGMGFVEGDHGKQTRNSKIIHEIVVSELTETSRN